MIRVEGDHVNWVLVVILVALALLLAMVSTSGNAAVPPSNSSAAKGADRAAQSAVVPAQERQEQSNPSELWRRACEKYQRATYAEARVLFERVLAVYPYDPAARMWAGMASYRAGDHAAAIGHWEAVCVGDQPVPECGVWPAVALAAAHLEAGRVADAARFIVPLVRGDFGRDVANHPVVSFYAALVYDRLAASAPAFRDAVEESLAEKFSPALASSDAGLIVSPNSRSWLIFLTKRSLERTVRGAWSLNWAAPAVPESATVEPLLAPTVADLLEALGSADFAAQAHRKLRALEIYESLPKRKIEIYDEPDRIKRGRFIA